MRDKKLFNKIPFGAIAVCFAFVFMIIKAIGFDAPVLTNICIVSCVTCAWCYMVKCFDIKN